jgi:DNA-binding transcriptional ArsR family regulator
MGKNYSDEFRNAMVKKLSGPNGRSATALAEEVGVPQSTLSRWLKDYGRFGSMGEGMKNKRRPQNWSAEEKFQAVFTYEGLAEEERGKYLREHGLYSVDIERWREEMTAVLNKKRKSGKGDPKDRRIKQLESELRRKEKALAEAAALLVLKKKADAIWGDDEDEK